MDDQVNTSRRKVLFVGAGIAAAAASGGALSSCSPPTNVLPPVIDAINKVIAGTCQIVPVVATLVDVVVTVFPQAAGAAVITDALAKQIADFVCGLVKQSGYVEGSNKMPVMEGGTLKAKLGGGKTIDLHFYATVNGKLVLI